MKKIIALLLVAVMLCYFPLSLPPFGVFADIIDD